MMYRVILIALALIGASPVASAFDFGHGRQVVRSCDPVWERAVPVYRRVKGKMVRVGYRCEFIPPKGGPSTGGGHQGGG